MVGRFVKVFVSQREAERKVVDFQGVVVFAAQLQGVWELQSDVVLPPPHSAVQVGNYRISGVSPEAVFLANGDRA